ncbi:hypothetical protein [Nocardioides sp.]|uniref:hypothetical protein n=1 Tax=Nocardioides sp. TaxID=35761 RepID=UPI0025DAA96E|nr:hypothetical protein [Nocardioides sp.]
MTGVVGLVRAWSGLPAPALEDVVGDLRAEFVVPLRHVAPAGLGLVGLPRWHGKRFAPTGGGELAGVNLLRAPGGGFEERLPMRAVLGVGLADGRPAVIVTYAEDAPRPWRWVRDELRVLDDGVLVGMSYVDRPLLRRGGLPFLLRP